MHKFVANSRLNFFIKIISRSRRKNRWRSKKLKIHFLTCTRRRTLLCQLVSKIEKWKRDGVISIMIVKGKMKKAKQWAIFEPGPNGSVVQRFLLEPKDLFQNCTDLFFSGRSQKKISPVLHPVAATRFCTWAKLITDAPVEQIPLEREKNSNTISLREIKN